MQTLTAKGCQQRRDKLRSHVDADLLIIANPRHIQYLSGLFITNMKHSGWGINFLLLDQQENSTLFIQSPLQADAAQAHVDEVITWTYYDVKFHPAKNPFSEAWKQFQAQLPNLTHKTIAYEYGWLPAGLDLGISIDVTPILEAQRRQKYPDEMLLIREAVRVTEAGHAAAREMIQPGISEIEVYNAVHSAAINEAGYPVQMLGDFVSGERIQGIGGMPTRRVLQPEDLIILDIFPIVNGYRADFTTTLSVGGQLTEQQAHAADTLHRALEAAESLLKPGTRTSDVYTTVDNILKESGYGESSHHAGHGLGLDHPEAPFFVANSDEILQKGDVVTLEPGIYGADYGGRIEHNYLITANGFERLTNHKTTFTP